MTRHNAVVRPRLILRSGSSTHGGVTLFGGTYVYAKIFEQILDSSIADDWKVRHVFIDLLILADREGVVDMTLSAIARRTGLPLEMVTEAIAILERPDPVSRSEKEDGRRIVPIDEGRGWGWKIVNFREYHAMRDEDARREYQRTYQQRRRTKSTPVNIPSTPINPSQPLSTHLDVHSDVHGHEDIDKEKSTPLSAKGEEMEDGDNEPQEVQQTPRETPKDVETAWNLMAETCGLPKSERMSEKRKDMARVRLADKWWREHWRATLALIPNRPFLLGRGTEGWTATILWFLKPDSVQNIHEGMYAEPDAAPRGKSAQERLAAMGDA